MGVAKKGCGIWGLDFCSFFNTRKITKSEAKSNQATNFVRSQCSNFGLELFPSAGEKITKTSKTTINTRGDTKEIRLIK